MSLTEEEKERYCYKLNRYFDGSELAPTNIKFITIEGDLIYFDFKFAERVHTNYRFRLEDLNGRF